MNFFEFEQIKVEKDSAMMQPHSHDFFELYFLLEGRREFFVENKMFNLAENTLVVVSPFKMHKTEGGPFRRININISADLLSDFQIEFLTKISEKIAVKLDKKTVDLISKLLFEGEKLQSSSIKNKHETLLSFAHTIINLLALRELTPVSALTIAHKDSNLSTEVLKILSYINKHYNQQINLKDLCNKFFLSKVSLCKKFKSVMNCSIMEYVSLLRLNKAKALLRDTNKSIEDISNHCGFSSANYFGLIFKKEVGLSPLNYRKTR